MRIGILVVLCSLWGSGVVLSQTAVAPAGDTTARTPEMIWPRFAPGETEINTGETLPTNPKENPPITRVINIRTPTMTVFPPKTNASGVAVLVLPGGGFGRVVPDLEGSEAADFLGQLGITTFVLQYRTDEGTPSDEPKWKRPLQDGQRAMRWIRQNANRWKLQPNKIGLLAFSAGGQVGAILATTNDAAYPATDPADSQPFRPDFSMLIYPWRCYDAKNEKLIAPIVISPQSSPCFIVHTDDDASTSLGAVLLYSGFKKSGVSAELHIYENGGHGYGTRPRPHSNIGSWKDRATDWLRRRI